MAKDRDDVRDVVLGLDVALAGVERLGAGDLRSIALEQVGDLGEHPASCRHRRGRPVAVVEGGAGAGLVASQAAVDHVDGEVGHDRGRVRADGDRRGPVTGVKGTDVCSLG